MGLTPEKWLPETNLEVKNWGDAPLEVKCHVEPEVDLFGKTFIAKPHSDTRMMAKEFLPPHITDYCILNNQNMSFVIKNIGQTKASFQIFEIGPFKIKTKLSTPAHAQKIINLYEEYMNNSDYYSMIELVNTPVSEEFKRHPAFYSAACFLRGKMLGVLLRPEEANVAFAEGWKDCYDTNRWFYLFNWASSLKNCLLNRSVPMTTKGMLIQKAIDVLREGHEWTKNMKYHDYHLIAATCLEAYLLCYLGEGGQVQVLFENVHFRTLTEDEFMDAELNNFFEFIMYGYFAALETKNAQLIRNLSNLVATGKSYIVHEPIPIMCMQHALVNMYERGRVACNTEMNNMVQYCNNLDPEFPNLRQFIKYLVAHDEIELENFVPYLR